MAKKIAVRSFVGVDEDGKEVPIHDVEDFDRSHFSTFFLQYLRSKNAIEANANGCDGGKTRQAVTEIKVSFILAMVDHQLRLRMVLIEFESHIRLRYPLVFVPNGLWLFVIGRQKGCRGYSDRFALTFNLLLWFYFGNRFFVYYFPRDSFAIRLKISLNCRVFDDCIFFVSFCLLFFWLNGGFDFFLFVYIW